MHSSISNLYGLVQFEAYTGEEGCGLIKVVWMDLFICPVTPLHTPAQYRLIQHCYQSGSIRNYYYLDVFFLIFTEVCAASTGDNGQWGPTWKDGWCVPVVVSSASAKHNVCRGLLFSFNQWASSMPWPCTDSHLFIGNLITQAILNSVEGEIAVISLLPWVTVRAPKTGQMKLAPND